MIYHASSTLNIMPLRSPVIDPGVKAFRLQHFGCTIEVEVSSWAVWILSIDTRPDQRHQGHATWLLDLVVRYCVHYDKPLHPGVYLHDGQLYLKHVIERLCLQHNAKLGYWRLDGQPWPTNERTV